MTHAGMPTFRSQGAPFFRLRLKVICPGGRVFITMNADWLQSAAESNGHSSG